MIRGIPPRTMADVRRERAHRDARGGRTTGRRDASRSGEQRPDVAPVALPARLRQWRYQTRPSFKRVRGPLVDVFNEAEEVLIVIDLGGFTRGEVSLTLSPRQYVLHAVRGDQRFDEVIDVPPNVDAARSQERLVNGVLEIVLPRTEVHRTPRTATRHSRKRRK